MRSGNGSRGSRFILVMMYVLSFLMVSNVKYISFKKVELFQRHPFHTLVGLVLIFVVIAGGAQYHGVYCSWWLTCLPGSISTFMYHRRAALAPAEKEEGDPPEAYRCSGFGPGRRRA